MDQGRVDDNSSCGEFVYLDDYFGYFVKYDNDLRSVQEIMKPDCVDVVNNSFLVAYKQAPSPDALEDFYMYGYNNLPKVYGLMDVPAVENIGGFAVRNLPGLSLDGHGVLVGFVDTGIDFRNPVFFDSDGNTRIEYIWDQNQESFGVGTPIFGYGGEYSKEDINAANALENPYAAIPCRDEVGHGTFMASLACGSERLEENFSGVAPKASIIMVKLKKAPKSLKDFYYVDQEDCYSETDIAQGIRYLINKAIDLGRPMVICLGMGTNQGGHDGSSNLERYIQALSGLRGICFVAPGGNELGGGIHYAGGRGLSYTDGEGRVTTTREEVVEINVMSNVQGFTTEIWGNAPGLLKIVIESPSGERLDTIIPNVTGVTNGDFVFEGSKVFVENVVVESATGDQLYFIRFTNPAQGIWRIVVEESIGPIGAGFDVWLPVTTFNLGRTRFINASPDTIITSPGNSQGCITASAYNNVNGAIYVLSSRGFTRKGNVKPDVTAPGVNIMGAFASGGGGALYTERSGTSVATALLGGGAALILQWGIVDINNLGINTEIIKQMIIRGASREKDLEYPNNIWGWGTLDLLQIFQNMRQ